MVLRVVEDLMLQTPPFSVISTTWLLLRNEDWACYEEDDNNFDDKADDAYDIGQSLKTS